MSVVSWFLRTDVKAGLALTIVSDGGSMTMSVDFRRPVSPGSADGPEPWSACLNWEDGLWFSSKTDVSELGPSDLDWGPSFPDVGSALSSIGVHPSPEVMGSLLALGLSDPAGLALALHVMES